MMNNTTDTEEQALATAKAYYASKYPSLSDVQLAAQSFEHGWLIGPSRLDDAVSHRLGVTMLIVDHDGSVTETSSSLPPAEAIKSYMSTRA